MAGQPFIKGYLSQAIGGSTTFSITWDSSSETFSLNGLPAGANACGFISRLDFFDYSGKLWMVVPCSSSCAAADSSQCSVINFTGNTVDINVSMVSLLSQPVKMAASFETGKDPQYSKIRALSFSLGDHGYVVRGYDDVINYLQLRGNIETTSFQVSDASATTPFNLILDSLPAGAPASTPFASDHVTTLARPDTLADGKTEVNVLTLRRGIPSS